MKSGVQYCFTATHVTSAHQNQRLCHQNRKFHRALPRPSENTEGITVVQQQTPPPASTAPPKRKAANLPAPSPSFSCHLVAADVNPYGTGRYTIRNLFQTRREALKPLADWPTSSNSLQKPINTRPRGCICDPQNSWISNVTCWKPFEKLTYTKYL